MQYRNIPYSDLSVSAICLGGAHFGSEIDAQKAMDMMDGFLELGGNFIDTANVYGKWLPAGRSESELLMGRWMKLRNSRSSIVLTTKGAHPHLNSMNMQRLSRDEIRSDLEKSLSNLGSEFIDLYWLHRDDPGRSVEEIIESMETFVRQGKIRYYGCSNWKPARLKAANDYAATHGYKGFIADQMMWSLAKPNPQALYDPNMVAMDDELWEYHKGTSIATVPYSAQANGYFSLIDHQPPEELLVKYDNSANRLRNQRLKELSARRNVSIPGVVLAYLINQPFVVVPTAGFENQAQMTELLKDIELKLTAEDIAYLAGDGEEA